MFRKFSPVICCQRASFEFLCFLLSFRFVVIVVCKWEGGADEVQFLCLRQAKHLHFFIQL